MPFDKPRIFSAGEHNDEARMVPAASGGPGQSAREHHARAALTSELGVCGESESSADDDLGLPAELQMLAAELRGEADMLAERYVPAGAPSHFDERRSMRRWIWRGIAVSLAGIALLTWQIERSPESPRPTAAAQTNALPSGVSTDAIRTISQAVPPSPDPAAIRRTQGIAEVGMDQPAADRHTPADQIEMLRMQLSGFEKVIQKLQLEIKSRDAVQIESQHEIESLQAEVATLRKQLDDKRGNAERR